MSHKCPLWRISGAFITVICNTLEICQIPSVSSGGVFGAFLACSPAAALTGDEACSPELILKTVSQLSHS